MNFESLRLDMVKKQIAGRGITDLRVLRAMESVPRQEFVPAQLRQFAYDDRPLPIGLQQTISQPYIVAFMAEAIELNKTDRVLDIGTGSGYAAAVLSRIACNVYSIERLGELAERARNVLASQGIANVEIICGDGASGWPERAPFDAIVVAAAGVSVPQALKQQLAIGGRLIIPIGRQDSEQKLTKLTRKSDSEFMTESLASVSFVPLISREGTC